MYFRQGFFTPPFYIFRKIFNTIAHVGSSGCLLIMTLVVSNEDKQLATTLVNI
jgi:hypothetical protein